MEKSLNTQDLKVVKKTLDELIYVLQKMGGGFSHPAQPHIATAINAMAWAKTCLETAAKNFSEVENGQV